MLPHRALQQHVHQHVWQSLLHLNADQSRPQECVVTGSEMDALPEVTTYSIYSHGSVRSWAGQHLPQCRCSWS